MAVLSFEGKGRTLEKLRGRLTKGEITPLIVFTVEEWRASSQALIERATVLSQSSPLIVRSSARAEDSSDQSLAGAFLSIPNVSRQSPDSIRQAVEQVIASYDDDNVKNDVVIQVQVEAIELCGVLFTRDLDTLAPYYVINYDDSGSIDSVTSGNGTSLKAYVRMRTSPYPVKVPALTGLIEAAEEIEGLFGVDALDIEFAVANGGKTYILQVRPIAAIENRTRVDDQILETMLFKVRKKAAKATAPHPGLCGKKGMYSVMTDWNPAEIIGIRPRRLALSLYKELVTDSIWAHQRHAYGYRDLRGYPLLLSFLGQPYIDVRVSVNSFIPRALDPKLADKLADYYVERLAQTPTDHDKVEFKIVHSCYYLNVAEKLKDLLNHGFSELELDRIKYALLDLTNDIISTKTGLYLEDEEKVEQLPKRYDEILSSDLSTIEKIYWLVEDCKRYGTLPFAGLARAGFIAMQFLHSLQQLDIISEQDFQAYMNSLNTVAKQLSTDTRNFGNGTMPRDEMLKKYGHLRPGTYDILSPCYAEQFDAYLGSVQASSEEAHSESFSFTPLQLEKIGEKLVENGLKVSVEGFLNFLRAAIEGREYSKFMFTRSLSQVLIQLEKLGERNNLSREDMSFVDIGTVLNLYSDLSHEHVRASLARDSQVHREAAAVAAVVRLPQLIMGDRDVYDFFVGEVEANFVTQRSITEVIVTEEDLLDGDLTNKIVFIRSADPGYDWVFSRNIGGLVTMYGGANSHMAIRCAELQIPAVIGCGEKNFADWSKSKILSIDCGNRQVKPVY